MTLTMTVLAAVLALFFIALGTAKIATPRAGERAASAGLSVPAYRVISVLEIAGGVGVAAGLAWWPLGAAAASGLLLLMFGAVLTHLRLRDGALHLAPAVVVGVAVGGYLIGLGAAR